MALEGISEVIEHTFVVNHEPIGQPRHRISTRGGHAKMYLPSRHPVHAFKAAVKAAHGPRNLRSGPLMITVVAVFPRPHSKIWKTRPMPRYWHTGKPDVDNVAKAVLDALSKVAFVDDNQIATLTISKQVASGDESARVFVTIREMR